MTASQDATTLLTPLQGLSLAEKLGQVLIVPKKFLHDYLLTQPVPFVIHPDKNSSQSLSVVNLALWVHNLSIQACVAPALGIFQHFF